MFSLPIHPNSHLGRLLSKRIVPSLVRTAAIMRETQYFMPLLPYSKWGYTEFGISGFTFITDLRPALKAISMRPECFKMALSRKIK